MKKNLTTDELYTAYYLSLGNPPEASWSDQKMQHYYLEFLALVSMTIHSTGLPPGIVLSNNEVKQILFSQFVKWIRDTQKARVA